MTHPLSHGGPIFLISNGRGLRPVGLEVVGGEVPVADQALDLLQAWLFAFGKQLHQCQAVLEVVEDQDILI